MNREASGPFLQVLKTASPDEGQMRGSNTIEPQEEDAGEFNRADFEELRRTNNDYRATSYCAG